MTDTPRWAWMDGEFVPWGAAKVHVRTECVMRGANVFEGVRGYWLSRSSDCVSTSILSMARRHGRNSLGFCTNWGTSKEP